MSDQNRPVKLTLTGRLSYSEDITLSQAAQIIAFLAAPTDAAASSFAPHAGLSKNLGHVGGSSSPREALEASGAKTNPERIVAFALHIRREGGKDTFKLDDLRPLFRRAGEPTPANISRDMENAIKSGWAAESGVRGEFYVTDKAVRVLETGFDAIRRSRGAGTRARASGRRLRASGGVSNGSVPEYLAGIDGISPTLDGYVDYHKLKTRREKFLWAVNFAKAHDVSGLSNQELEWLTDRLGDCISSQNINANYQPNLKDGYVNRSNQDGRIRITPKGEEHLKTLSAERAK
jgi:hypothetical protein